MATDVRTVISRFEVQDDFTVKVQAMGRAVEQFDRNVQRAQQHARSGFTTAFAGASGVPLGANLSQFAGFQLAGLGQGARAFGASGGALSDLLTLPLRAASGFMRLGGAIAFLAGGPIGLAIGAVGLLAGTLLDFVNVPLAILGKAIEAVGGFALKTATAIGGALTAAFVGVLFMSGKIAAQFDQLERSFGAFLGSPAKGKQAARFVEAFGLTSPFEQLGLQEAARSLLAVNLSLSQFLPVVQAIALRRGVSTENIMEVARIVMEVAGGATGRAFGPQGLGRFGISREMLERFGGRFDRQGSFIGTPLEALQVLLRLGSSAEFQAINKAFEDAPAVKFSNALDAINKALRDLGSALLPRIVPLVEKFADAMLRVSSSGILGDMAEGFGKMFSIDFKNVEDGLNRLIAGVGAFIATLPELIQAAVSVISAGLQLAMAKVKAVLDGLMLHPIFLWLRLINFATNLPPLSHMKQAAGQASRHQLDEATSQFSESMRSFHKTWDEFTKKVSGASAEIAAEDPSKENALQNAVNAAVRGRGTLGGGALPALTGADFRRFALGGGDVGRLGLTDVDLHRIGAFGSQRPEVRVRVHLFGAGRIEELLEHLLQQTLEQFEAQRSRVLKTART